MVAIGLIALNMRGPFVAVAPVVGDMQRDLGFSPVEIGFLTGIPVLCFALAAPLASLTGRKLGPEFAITLTLLGVLIGEMFASQRGLGYMAVNAMGLGDIPTIMAVALLITIIAVTCNSLMLMLDKKLQHR